MSVGVKDKILGGIYKPPEDIFTDKADRAGITYHLGSYGIMVEFVTSSLFLMFLPLNMTDAKFAQIVSIAPVPFKTFTLPTEKQDGS